MTLHVMIMLVTAATYFVSSYTVNSHLVDPLSTIFYSLAPHPYFLIRNTPPPYFLIAHQIVDMGSPKWELTVARVINHHCTRWTWYQGKRTYLISTGRLVILSYFYW